MGKKPRTPGRVNRQRAQRFRRLERAVAENQDTATRARARYARGENTGRCPPPCGKVAAPSLEAAKTLRAKAAARHRNKEPVRYYECRITRGVWHWTRQMETPRWMETN